MTVLTRTPENTNLLQPTKFLVTIDRIPETQYFCQKVNIPGMRMPEAKVDSPFHNYTVAGLNIQYNSFDISFLVDEELQSWKDMYNWFTSIADPDGFEQRDHSRELKQNKKFSFRPSMTASADIQTKSKSNVIAVPLNAVTTRDKEGEGKDTNVSVKADENKKEDKSSDSTTHSEKRDPRHRGRTAYRREGLSDD